MNNSDTPRTDAKEKETARVGHYKHAYYGWKFARELERELNAALARLQEQEQVR